MRYRPSQRSEDQSDRARVVRAHALLCAADDLLRTAYAELKAIGVCHAMIREAQSIVDKAADEIAEYCSST